MKWIVDILNTLDKKTKTIVVILMVVMAGCIYFAKEYFDYKIKYLHEQNESGTRIRNLEVALENCQ